MGQKTNPTGFRMGVTLDWLSHWFARDDNAYVKNVLEDKRIRDFIVGNVGQTGVKNVEIERFFSKLKITIYVARPGMIIGRGGSRIELLRAGLEKICGVRPELLVEEVKAPGLSAKLVSEEVARQIERRRHPARVILMEADKVMMKGALGVKIEVGGRLGGAEIARRDRVSRGSVPLQTLRARIDYGLSVARTKYGAIGVKVWVYTGKEAI